MQDTYYQRLARFCGKSPSSVPTGKKGGRHFDYVYGDCIESLPKRVDQLQRNDNSAFEGIEVDAKIVQEKVSQENLGFRLDGKKAVYKNTESNGSKAKKSVKLSGGLDAKDVDPWKLRNQKDIKSMTSPPLEMFCFRRIGTRTICRDYLAICCVCV